jgi:cytidyltransferase-like protein
MAAAAATTTATTTTTNNKVYQSAVLELLYRAESVDVGAARTSSTIAQVLENDDILSKVTSFVQKNLYIYVVCLAASGSSSSSSIESNSGGGGKGRGGVSEYISSLYSRVWDEMLQKGTLDLNCVVVGDMPGSGLVSRTELCSHPSVEAVFTFEAEGAAASAATHAARLAAGLPPVDVVNTHRFTATAATASLPPAAVNAPVYYLDDAFGVEVPVYRKAALGGTFDQLHNGHRKLLTLAAASCKDTLVVGITGDVMLQKKKNASAIAPYGKRKDGVAEFLALVKPGLALDLCELSDPFGPTVTDPDIEAIVVSSETVPGAHKINEVRVSKGFRALDILVSRRSEAATLSSTFLRSKA